MECRKEDWRSIMLEETLKKCPAVCYKLQFKTFHNRAGVNKGYGINVAIIVKNQTGMTLISPKFVKM